MTTTSRLDCGHDYAAKKIHVFPTNGKDPRVRWREDSTTDAATIRGWWTRWPDAGIGVDCGKSVLVVVDLDVKDGVDGVAAWKQAHRWPTDPGHLLRPHPPGAGTSGSATQEGDTATAPPRSRPASTSAASAATYWSPGPPATPGTPSSPWPSTRSR